MITTTEKDTMVDYIDTMAVAMHDIRYADISADEREKLMREVEDGLYNLKRYTINGVA